MSSASKVKIRPARSLADYLFTRRLRNQVYLNMTGNPAPISLWQQLKFYWRRPAGFELFIAVFEDRRAGYLLLRPDGSTWLITEAVAKEFRGHGVATAMVRFAQSRFGDLTAHILLSNSASLRLHESCGFTRSSEDKQTAQYRLISPVLTVAP